MKNLDEKILRQTASEACLLLNEAIRELTAPVRVFDLSTQWQNLNPVPMKAIFAVRNMILRSVIVNLYRLQETRDGFLKDWLYSDKELLALGFPPVELFFPAGKWKQFEIVRHQYAGHSTGTKARRNRPAQIVPAARLGKALKETGLADLQGFLQRIQSEVLPGVEKVRDDLTSSYPCVQKFVTETYPSELEAASNVSSPD